jgi:3-dehydroquinate synthetase
MDLGAIACYLLTDCLWAIASCLSFKERWTDVHRMTRAPQRSVAASHERSFNVALCPGLSAGRVDDLVQGVKGRKCLLITTPTVAELYANRIASRLLESGVNLSTLVLPCSEQSKTCAEVERLCKECFRAGLDRRSVLIGCGGGVCTDLVTMVAALTRRGLGHIKIPTTLIGLIDAGIGIKGAVNLPGKKSAIGCFYPPERVFLDPSFLRTLPRQLISDGLAEAIKVAITFDAALFQRIEQTSRELLENPLQADYDRLTDLVWRSSNLLLDELETNLYEDQTYERLLDFGHTFSPMIEAMSGFDVRHGMSVAIDMALSTAVSYSLGFLSCADQDRILRLLLGVGLPIFSHLLNLECCSKALDEIEAHRGGHLNLVIPRGIGKAVFLPKKEQVPQAVLNTALNFLRKKSQQYNRTAANATFLDPSAAERIPRFVPANFD